MLSITHVPLTVLIVPKMYICESEFSPCGAVGGEFKCSGRKWNAMHNHPTEK